MTSQSLSGAWQLRQAGSNEWLAAQVPGGVHTDLMAAGRIADPFVGDEELRVQWVAEADWEYRRTFRVEAAVAAENAVLGLPAPLRAAAETNLVERVLRALPENGAPEIRFLIGPQEIKTFRLEFRDRP